MGDYQHVSGMLNGNRFEVEVSIAPTQFINSTRKIHHNKTRVVVKRVIVCKFRVSEKNRSPEGFTFVPVFLSNTNDLLDPATCDTIGRLAPNGEAEFSSRFIWKYENGQDRVRAKEVVLQPESDLGFSFEERDEFAIDQPVVGGGAARKRSVKTPPGLPVKGAKRPFDNELSSVGDLSSDEEVPGFECDNPAGAQERPESPDPGEGGTECDSDLEDPEDQDQQEQEPLSPSIKKQRIIGAKVILP